MAVSSLSPEAEAKQALEYFRTAQTHGRCSELEAMQQTLDVFRPSHAEQVLKTKREDHMKLFEYAAFYVGADKSVIVVEPKTVLAKTEDVAKSLAARAIPEEYADRLDKVTVVVRPFF